MSKNILIVYYSLTGNTRFIAESIKDVLEAQIQEIKPIKEINPKGSMKYLWGGMRATMKKKPELEPIEKDPKDYDILFLGTPVWAWTFTPPIRSFISKFDLSEKVIAIWCCHGGSSGKTLKKLESSLENSHIIGKIEFQDPLKNNPEDAKKKVIEWAKNIIKDQG